MSTTTTTGASATPSPHRTRVGLTILLLGLIGGPGAWIAQLLASYIVASRVCYPHDQPLHGIGAESALIWSLLLAINVAALVIALLCASVSYRSWRATRAEQPGSTSHLLEVGEGRTRFIAVVGMLAGLGFCLAILFDTVALFVVPPCIG